MSTKSYDFGVKNMKVTIIKGPRFEENQKKAYEFLYQIASERVLKNTSNNQTA